MGPTDPFQSTAQITEVRQSRTRPARFVESFVRHARYFGWGKEVIGPTGGPLRTVREERGEGCQVGPGSTAEWENGARGPGGPPVRVKGIVG
jgi:hypothetical protein